MYITYEAAQWVWTDWFGDSQNRKIFKQNKPPEIVPNRLPKPDFMPSKLVRTYDMKVVPGSQVNEGYCTISYSWNQSGEVDYSNKEKATRTDEGKHKIIYIDQKIRRRGKKNKRILYKVRYVKFEGLIQQICRQFNINYVWYDQMCINQEDKEEKKREIRNMHRVYGNAHCLVALVPEYHVTYLDKHLYKKKQYRLNFEASCDDNDSIHFRCYGSARFALSFALQNIQTSEWCKRLWTLEESLKSKTLLFIGQNTHLYAKNDNSGSVDTFISHLLELPEKISLNTILYNAHQRTSTNEHDRVFALANLFPDIVQQIMIDYHQPIKDLLIHFYGLLAKKDITILFFKRNDDDMTSYIQKYDFLPSWTGVNGYHYSDNMMGYVTFQNCYTVEGETMYVKCAGITKKEQPIQNNSLSSFTSLKMGDLPLIPTDYDGTPKMYYLGVVYQVPGKKQANTIRLFSIHQIHPSRYVLPKDRFDMISKTLQYISRLFEIKKEDLYWYTDSDKQVLETEYSIMLNSLTEDMDDLDTEYVILSGILFSSPLNSDDFYPVIKKRHGEKYYKAIGVMSFSKNTHGFFSDCNLPEQTYFIQ